MKISILDVYPSRPFRVTKDSNGGFGTANDYGDGLVPRALARYVAAGVDWAPLYVAYVAGELKAKGHEVAYTRVIASVEASDLVILVSSIVAHETELEAIRNLSEQAKLVAVIGPFATAVPEPYINSGATVVFGEAEEFFRDPDFFDHLRTAHNRRVLGGVVSDLDSLAGPDWGIFASKYKQRMGLLGRGIGIPIAASRGCPYSCSHYCTYPLQQGSKLRQRDPSLVVREMAHWQDQLGASAFIFRDPVFGINRLNALEFARQIKLSGRRFKFIIEAHLKNIDEELAASLKEAGLSILYTGIESVTEEVILDAKRYTIEFMDQKRRVRMLESKGVRVKAMFMFGFPKDTKDTCRANIAAAIDLRPSYAQFSVFTPYPGTPVFNSYKEKVIAKSYEEFTQWDLVFKHENLERTDVRLLLNEAYTRFYTNPNWLIRQALSSRP